MVELSVIWQAERSPSMRLLQTVKVPPGAIVLLSKASTTSNATSVDVELIALVHPLLQPPIKYPSREIVLLVGLTS